MLESELTGAATVFIFILHRKPAKCTSLTKQFNVTIKSYLILTQILMLVRSHVGGGARWEAAAQNDLFRLLCLGDWGDVAEGFHAWHRCLCLYKILEFWAYLTKNVESSAWFSMHHVPACRYFHYCNCWLVRSKGVASLIYFFLMLVIFWQKYTCLDFAVFMTVLLETTVVGCDPQAAASILNCGISHLRNSMFPVWLLGSPCWWFLSVSSLTGRQHRGEATENCVLFQILEFSCYNKIFSAVSFISKFTVIPPLTIDSKNRDAPYGKPQWIRTITYAYKRKHHQIFLKLAWIDTLGVSKSCLCLWDGTCWQKDLWALLILAYSWLCRFGVHISALGTFHCSDMSWVKM